MKWIKKGKIFNVSGQNGWMNSHAQVPTVLVMEDRLRVYFSTRPQSNLGLTTFLDLNRNNPKEIIYIHDKPILDVGKPGTFDSHGVFPSHVMLMDGKIYLYYLGWYRGSTVPYHNAIGLAISEDGGLSFKKAFEGPIVDRTPQEPYSTMALYIVEKDGLYYMYYTVVYDWILVNEKYEPVYHINLATSKDGIVWNKTGRVCIKENVNREAIARPAVICKDGKYHMWFSFRGSDDFRDGKDSYRIGYAWSNNLIDWSREDSSAGISVSDTGWDSTMIDYPCVVEIDGEYLMFYNGNSFGASGFGYAILSWEGNNENR